MASRQIVDPPALPSRGLRRYPRAALLVLLPVLVCVPSSAATKKLRLEAIASEGALTGPTPTQLRWSPDGRLLTYILQRDDRDKRDLWAIDRISGENRVLVTTEKLASLAPAAKASHERRAGARASQALFGRFLSLVAGLAIDSVHQLRATLSL